MSALFRARIQHTDLTGSHRPHGALRAFWGICFITASIASASASTSAGQPSGPLCYDALQSETAHISRVTDGDTVVLKDDRRVRLIGINTAELNARNPKLKKAALNATRELTKLLPTDTAVTLFLGEESRDRHGRVLAHVVRTEDKLPVASLMVSAGFAVQSAVAPNTRCASHFAKVESEAFDANAGDWDKLSLFGKAAATLSGNERGFHFVTGRVTRIETHKRYTEVFLEGRFRLLLRPTLARTMSATKLDGKTVQVRGWLNHRKKQAFLWLQHQSNLRVLDP